MRFTHKFSLFILAWFAGLPALAAPPAELAPQLLDWQLYDERPFGEVCPGFYQAPEIDLPEANLNFNLARLFTESNQISQNANKEINLAGDVTLRRGGVFVSADKAWLDANHENSRLEGDITLRQAGMLLRGETADYNLRTEELSLNTAHYVVHEQRLRGSAWRLEQDASGKVILRDASLTTCIPQDNAWRLVASKIKLNQDTGFGDAYNVRMHIQKVPVFYWPWLRFPIDDRRHTGLLAPSISWSKKAGLDYLQPIYVNLAPNYDATFYPRQIDKRGFLMGSEFRYLTSQHEGEIYYAKMREDKEFYTLPRWQFSYQGQGDLGIAKYKLNFNQVSDDLYLTNFNASKFIKASDDLLQQLVFTNNFYGWNTKVNFQGYQKLKTNKEEADLLEQGYKLFDLRQGRIAKDQDYFMLPQVELTRRFNLGNEISANLLIDVTKFSKLVDPELEEEGGYFASSGKSHGSPDATRLRITPSLTANWRWPWAYIKPEAKLHHTRYKLSPFWLDTASEERIAELNTKPSASVPVTSLDTGLFFERDARLLGNNFLQTLEPRLFAAYVPYVEQHDVPHYLDGSFNDEDLNTLFRAERTGGRDRVGDVKKVTLGLTQRLISRVTSKEVASLSLAKAFYLDDRYLEEKLLHPERDEDKYPKDLDADERDYKDVRKTSNLAVQATFSPTSKIKFTSNLFWDDYFHKTEKANNYLTLKPFSTTELNFGHIYTSEYQKLRFKGAKPDKDLLDDWSYLEHAEEQYYASMIYALNDNWRFFFKQSYDWKHSEKLDSITGVEYNSCCWQLQLVYRDWVEDPDATPIKIDDGFERRERDYGFFVTFVFKGLGGVGQNIPELLTEELQGYQSRR